MTVQELINALEAVEDKGLAIGFDVGPPADCFAEVSGVGVEEEWLSFENREEPGYKYARLIPEAGRPLNFGNRSKP